MWRLFCWKARARSPVFLDCLLVVVVGQQRSCAALFVRLLVCLLAWLLACLLSCLLARLLAGLLAFAYLLACLLAGAAGEAALYSCGFLLHVMRACARCSGSPLAAVSHVSACRAVPLVPRSFCFLWQPCKKFHDDAVAKGSKRHVKPWVFVEAPLEPTKRLPDSGDDDGGDEVDSENNPSACAIASASRPPSLSLSFSLSQRLRPWQSEFPGTIFCTYTRSPWQWSGCATSLHLTRPVRKARAVFGTARYSKCLTRSSSR